MARIRTIRPDFWTDTKMADLSPWARLLYIALWNYADDEGRGRWLPKAIEGFAFPNDEVDILELLTELSDAERIVLYDYHDEAFFFIPTWHRHQKINRPTYSLIPPPLSLSEDSLKAHGALTETVDPAFERFLSNAETKGA